MWVNQVLIRPTSNYLAILTPSEAFSECTFDSYRSSHPGNQSATEAQTHNLHSSEKPRAELSNRFYKHYGHKAMFFAALKQRPKIAISVKNYRHSLSF